VIYPSHPLETERGNLGWADVPDECGLQYHGDGRGAVDVMLRAGTPVSVTRINPRSEVLRVRIGTGEDVVVIYASRPSLLWLGATLQEFAEWAEQIDLPAS